MPDVEHALLSKIISSGHLEEVMKAGVTAAFFHDEEHGGIWDWVAEFWVRYSKEPGREALVLEHPQYQLVNTPEPLAYYIDAIMVYHRRYKTVDLVADAAQYIKEENIEDALSALSDGLFDIARRTARTDDEDVLVTWQDRLGEWADLKEESGELIGIPTGFPFIDSATGGLQAEQFVVLVGPAKSGKSSIALKIAITASNAGYSVALISFEMSNREQEARHDGMRAGFNPNLLLWGKTTNQQDEALYQALRRIKNNPSIYLIHDMGARSLTSVVAKVHQYKPDLVIVDGAYLIDAEIPGVEAMDTRALTKISRSLKVLAQTRKIPVLATTQALDSKWQKKTGLTLTSAGYSSAWGQDCDVMLGIEGADDENVAKLRVVGGRNVGRHLAYITYDWDHGLIEEREGWQGGDDDDDEGGENS